MASTSNYHQSIINDFITTQRLNSYRTVFNCGNDDELVGAYLWNTNVCAALYPLLNTAEITLRNSINKSLRTHIGDNFWWRANKLHFKSFPTTDLPFVVKAIRNNFSNATNQVKRDKRQRYSIHNPMVNSDEVIAKTEFSTWEFILDSEFMGDNLIWPSCLGSVFKGAWSEPQASRFLDSTKKLVKTVREFRNRVSHHEPVWKKYGVINANDAVTHLNEKIDKIIELIYLVSPEKGKLIEQKRLVMKARKACSMNELRRCQNLVPINKVNSISKLGCLVEKANINNESIDAIVYKKGGIKFTINPYG